MKRDPFEVWLMEFAIWISAIVLLFLLIGMLAGCKTSPPVVKNLLTTPPSPWGPSGPPAAVLAVSRAAAVIGPPKPIIFAFDVPQTFSDMQGTNLWHPLLYVQTSTNMVDWQTVRTVPLGETPTLVYVTNASPFGAVRTGW